MPDKEIIDLTTDDHEVIIVESGDESHERPTKRARESSLGPTGRGDAQEMVNGVSGAGAGAGAEGKKKSRRSGKKKRKKVTVVGDEDGEVIEFEATEDSGAVSRDDSREQTDAEGQSKDAPGKASKAKDLVIRSLLDRLADAEDIPTVYTGDGLHRLNSDSREKKKRKKKRKRGDSDRERITTASTTNPDSAANNAEDDSLGPDLFFIDDTPVDVPADAKLSDPARVLPSTPAASSATEKVDEGQIPLLLPAHVSISERDNPNVPLQIIPPPPSESEDEVYIEYLDYDDDRRVCVHHLLRYVGSNRRPFQAPGVVRYFDDPADGAEPKTAKIVCKKCGAEGDHKTWNCPVIIVSFIYPSSRHLVLLTIRQYPFTSQCLTCGVRNEHGTRSCPISKICFTCGMKGHINRVCMLLFRCLINNIFSQDCPNRYAGRARMGGDYFNDCDRCGSSHHQTNVRTYFTNNYAKLERWSRNARLCGVYIPMSRNRSDQRSSLRVSRSENSRSVKVAKVTLARKIGAITAGNVATWVM